MYMHSPPYLYRFCVQETLAVKSETSQRQLVRAGVKVTGKVFTIARKLLVDPHSRHGRMWDTGYPSPVGSRLPHRPPSVCRRPRGPGDRVRGEERNFFELPPFSRCWDILLSGRRLGWLSGGVAGVGDGVLLLQARYVQKAG